MQMTTNGLETQTMRTHKFCNITSTRIIRIVMVMIHASVPGTWWSFSEFFFITGKRPQAPTHTSALTLNRQNTSCPKCGELGKTKFPDY